MSKTRMLSGMALAASLLATSAVEAQPKKPAETQSASDKERLAEAKAHYEAGLPLYEAGDYDAARVEFERAYALSHNYKILYNLGLILKLKSDYVGAMRNFELYLEEGVDAPEIRKQEVANEIKQLKLLVANIDIKTNVPGAEVLIDDVPVGKTPLKKPIVVNPGRRRVSATAAGRVPTAKAVDIASRDSMTVTLDLPEERQVIVLEKRPLRLPWVGYAVTGALAVTAGITGYVALNASNTLSDELAKPETLTGRFERLGSRGDTFGLVADIATVGAIVAGAISIYYTIKWRREDSQKAPTTGWLATPGGVAGTF